MTRIEKAIEIESKNIKDSIIAGRCPYNIDNKLPDLEDETKTFDSYGHTIGCRGLKCEECWNQEIVEVKELNCYDCEKSDFFYNDARSCDGPYSLCECKINGMDVLFNYRCKTRHSKCPLRQEDK